jgi:flagellar protein FliO/FliZ
MKKLHVAAGAILLFLLLPAAYAEAAQAADQSSGGVAINLLKVVGALLAVLAMMAASAWALKRFNVAKAGGDRTIKIVGGVSVGNRERVIVVEVADQWIVVGVAPGRVASLATMPRQQSAAPVETAPAAGNFAAWLKQTLDKRNAK